MKVFISYPSESFDLADLLVNKLKSEGVDVWFDDVNIRVSETIAERIRRGIQESACCLFILNSYSLESKWCHAEVGGFWGAGKPIVIYPVDPKCDVPSYLAGMKFAKSVDEILQSIVYLLEQADLDSNTIEVDQSQAPYWPTLVRNGMVNAFRIPAEDTLRQERVCQLIDREVETNGILRLSASSGRSYINPDGWVWKARISKLIQRGRIKKMEVILESPFSDFAFTRAIANRVTKHHWEEKQPPSNLIELLQYPNISIRVTEQPVNCSLFFTSEAVYYDPYIWAVPEGPDRTENNFWVFEFQKIDNVDDDSYTLLNRHFNFLRQYSVPLEETLHSPEPGAKTPLGKAFYDLFHSQKLRGATEEDNTALKQYYARTRKFRAQVIVRSKSGEEKNDGNA